MKADHEPEMPDDAFVDLLVQYDEQVAGGSKSVSGDSTHRPVTGDVQVRLQRARRCVDLLEHLRRLDPQSMSLISQSWRLDSCHELELPDADHLAETVEPDAPRSIGRFRILRELGRGGYGIVYLALDPQLDRQLALKIPRPEILVSQSLRERFLREGKAVASLSHNHLVPVFEAGQEGPICYLASSYCRGVSLADLLQSGNTPMPFSWSARVVACLADAMQHAHQRGVIHRDLKPSNVLLDCGDAVDDPAQGIPRITDFGLAKVDSERSDETREGAILGTPSYMAPEQAASRMEDIGPATDTYALGAILYELITARPPFKAETDLATIRQVELKEPVAPRHLRPDTPRDLESICLKCLEKDPAARYASASELSDDLNRFLRQTPVRARRIGNTERLWRWSRRNPAVAGLLSLVFVLLLGVAVGSTVAAFSLAAAWERTDDALGVAEKNYDEADRQRLRAEANFAKVRDVVEKLLVEVGAHRLTGQPGMESARRRLVEESLSFYEDFLQQQGDDPGIRLEAGRAFLVTGLIYHWLGNHHVALERLNRSIQLLEMELNTAPADSRMHLSRAYTFHGLTHVSLGNWEPAERSYRRAIELTDGSADLTHEARLARAQALNGLGHLLARGGTVNAEAERRLDESIAILSAQHQQHPEAGDAQYLLIMVMSNRAWYAEFTGDKQGAEQIYYQAGQIADDLMVRQPLPDYRQQAGKVHGAIAAFEIQRGQIDLGCQHYEKGVEILRDLTQDFPDVIQFRVDLSVMESGLAWSLYQRDEWEASSRHFRTSLDLLRAAVQEAPDDISHRRSLGYSLNNFGILVQGRGELDESEQLYREAVDIRRQLAEIQNHDPSTRSELGGSLHNLAMILEHRGHVDEAEKLYEEALAHQQFAYNANPQHPNFGRFLRNHVFSVASLARHRQDRKRLEELADLPIEIFPDSWQEYFLAGQRWMWCMTIVADDESLGEPERDSLRQQYLNLASERWNEAMARIPDDEQDTETLSRFVWWLAVRDEPELQHAEKALQYATRMTQVQPDNPSYITCLAAAQIANSQDQEAIASLERVLEITDGGTMQHWSMLAVAHANASQIEQARTWYQKTQAELEKDADVGKHIRIWVERARAKLAE